MHSDVLNDIWFLVFIFPDPMKIFCDLCEQFRRLVFSDRTTCCIFESVIVVFLVQNTLLNIDSTDHPLRQKEVFSCGQMTQINGVITINWMDGWAEIRTYMYNLWIGSHTLYRVNHIKNKRRKLITF